MFRYSDTDLMRGIPASEIRSRDAEREAAIKEVLPLSTVWECEIEAQIRSCKEMREFFADCVIKVRPMEGFITNMFRGIQSISDKPSSVEGPRPSACTVQ